MRIGLIILTTGLLIAGAQAARAFTGDCYLSVRQHVYLDGLCNIELQSGGSFSIGAGDRLHSRYFAYVEVGRTPGVAMGYWNGVAAESHADEDLGPLFRHGGCWANRAAKVCAWRLGTRPPSF